MAGHVRLAAALVLATCLGCGADSEDARPRPAESPGTSTVPGGEVLFADTFEDDRNRWGEIEDGEFGTIRMTEGDQRWIDATGRVLVWGPGTLIDQVEAGTVDLTNVTVRAELTVVDGGGVFGVACRVGPDDDADMQWYEFVVRDGYAAIRLSDEQSHIEVLAEGSDATIPFGTAIRVEGTCRDDAAGAAHLALALNGAEVLEVTVDEPLPGGWAAPAAWTYPTHAPMNVHWHEFAVLSA